MLLALVLAWVLLIFLMILVGGVFCELYNMRARVYPGNDRSRLLTTSWFENVIDQRIRSVLKNSSKKLVGWFLDDNDNRRKVVRIVQESTTEYEVEYIRGTIHTIFGASPDLKKKWIPKKALIRYMTYEEISDKILEIVEQIKKKK